MPELRDPIAMSSSDGNAQPSEMARVLSAALDDEALRELALQLLPYLEVREVPESPNHRLLTTADAAERAGVNVETVRRAIRAGELPVAARIGRSPRLTALALDAWLAKTAQRQPASGPRARRSRRPAQPPEFSLIAAFKKDD